MSPFVDESGDGQNKFDKSNPIVLLDSKDSKIIVYMDETAATDSGTVKYTYDYGVSFEMDDSCHRGLGFHDVVEESPSVIEEGYNSNLEIKFNLKIMIFYFLNVLIILNWGK